MSKLQPPWDLYLALQTKLKDSPTVDDASWGREAALNRILASEEPRPVDEIERVARSEGRRERHRARLRRRYFSREISHPDGEAVVQARQQLRLVKATVSEDDWSCLVHIGKGVSYNEIAAASGIRAGTIRARILRLRHRIIRHAPTRPAAGQARI